MDLQAFEARASHTFFRAKSFFSKPSRETGGAVRQMSVNPAFTLALLQHLRRDLKPKRP
jgi:hypothetical protein